MLELLQSHIRAFNPLNTTQSNIDHQKQRSMTEKNYNLRQLIKTAIINRLQSLLVPCSNFYMSQTDEKHDFARVLKQNQKSSIFAFRKNTKNTQLKLYSISFQNLPSLGKIFTFPAKINSILLRQDETTFFSCSAGRVQAM